MDRRWIAGALAAAMAASVLVGLAGCVQKQQTANGGSNEVAPAPIRIGVLPTEDALPLWVAEQRGLFKKAGIDVQIVTFQAAQERDAAFASGSIDAYMGDIIASAMLEAGGSPVSLATVMLGATPKQGRFGIVAKPGSKATTLADLAGAPIGMSSASIQEYVVDKLMASAGVPAEKVKKEIVPKVPVRLELLMSGKLEAAALPEPLLSLAEKQGAVLIADDTEGENLTQTVLGVSDKYLAMPGGMVTVGRLLDAWDEAVDVVNSDPNAWRALLVEKARLPEPIKETYAVNEYPKAQQPTEQMVTPVIEWMRAKGLLKSDLGYGDLVQQIPR
ncbi:MetQ/NlpA family ABC transporter substrate-binding protein [Coriobacteriia bacterium Es71-Z0120]|uniref:ABC transporter substrate-binding protein n=1 Tax=Parvivirga hydrogeniphila TaxID=2939460 RepID=UPI002260AB04|nr:MetQ/NlpA family ABC transporter substrate-binding protein [Parvivirga hydrogeniphila]MCL4078246.1 MetQ/NlpA family ABC transporter substrate-binding protein [Parvivirga hydrogeniphila]